MNPSIRDKRRTRRVERAVEGIAKHTPLVGMQAKDLEWKPPKGLRVKLSNVVQLVDQPPVTEEVTAPAMMSPLDIARIAMRRSGDEPRLDTAI